MPVTGSLAGFLPLRLGGDAQTGWTAAQHARFCADAVALQRVQPLATWVYEQTGSGIDDAEVLSYVGRNGSGLAWAPAVVPDSVGIVDCSWSTSQWVDDHTGYALPVSIRAVTATAQQAGRYATAEVTTPRTVRVRLRTHAGLLAQVTPITVTVWGTVGGSHSRAIGDYAGDPNKEDSTTEGQAPYAEFLLREIASQRGTAYTKESGTLVDVENVALARFWSAIGPRLAEKYRANCIPARSDERLPYWEQFLAVPKRLNERKWRTRQKLAAHYRLSEGASVYSIETELRALLGDAFVSMTWSQGADLANPPAQTFWPGVNPGDPTFSLGGGAWTSERNFLVVTVQWPPNMSLPDFQNMLDVDLFQMLDRLLPVWAGFGYSIQATASGFILNESLLGFTTITES